MPFALTFYPKGRVSKTVKSGFKNLFEKLLSECTQRQSYVIYSIANCGKYALDYEAPSPKKRPLCLVFFTLNAFVSMMTAATRAQGPFTSTQAGNRAVVIQETSASWESVSEEKKPS